MIALFHDALNRELETVVLEKDESAADLHSCGEVMTRVYMAQVAPRVQPAAIERHVEGPIGDGLSRATHYVRNARNTGLRPGASRHPHENQDGCAARANHRRLDKRQATSCRRRACIRLPAIRCEPVYSCRTGPYTFAAGNTALSGSVAPESTEAKLSNVREIIRPHSPLVLETPMLRRLYSRFNVWLMRN